MRRSGLSLVARGIEHDPAGRAVVQVALPQPKRPMLEQHAPRRDSDVRHRGGVDEVHRGWLPGKRPNFRDRVFRLCADEAPIGYAKD